MSLSCLVLQKRQVHSLTESSSLVRVLVRREPPNSSLRFLPPFLPQQEQVCVVASYSGFQLGSS